MSISLCRYGSKTDACMHIFLFWNAMGKPDSCLVFVSAVECGSLENEDGLAVCKLCLKAVVSRAWLSSKAFREVVRRAASG